LHRNLTVVFAISTYPFINAIWNEVLHFLSSAPIRAIVEEGAHGLDIPIFAAMSSGVRAIFGPAFTSEDKKCRTSFQIALMKGYVDIAKLLSDYGARAYSL